MFNGREKFWAGIVGGIIVLWIIGVATFTMLRPAAVTTPTDADYDAAANVMHRFDERLVPGVATTDYYITQLKLVKPKCTESLVQIVDLFEDAAVRQASTLRISTLASIDVLTAYNSENSKRAEAWSCASDVMLVVPQAR